MYSGCKIKSIWIGVFIWLSAVVFHRGFPIFLDLTDVQVLEISKCPACFGVTLCPAFLKREITLELLTSVLVLNSKNVFFGHYGDKPVRYLIICLGLSDINALSCLGCFEKTGT